MTELKMPFEAGDSNLIQEQGPKKKAKRTGKQDSWKHRMYELEIAIAKESNPRRKSQLIKIYNSYMGEYDSLRKQIIWLAVLGGCFLVVLAVFGYFLWDSYTSENMAYTGSQLQTIGMCLLAKG